VLAIERLPTAVATRTSARYDKVARSDVLWRAWGEVRANRGAAGVGGITIDDVVASGVASFLDELAARPRAGTYRSDAEANS
jgi:hypothetical protein